MKFELTPEEFAGVMQALAKFPYEQVAPLLAKLQQQAQAQTSEVQNGDK